MSEAIHDPDKIDIIHHLTDAKELEFFQYKLHLPSGWYIPGTGIDISPTKHVVMIWIVAALMLALFVAVGRQRTLVPTGLKNFFEAILLYLRDEVLHPILGHHTDKFLPFFWTLFFFILFMNLLGLVPFGATATGNINVTLALALIAFVTVHVSGMIEHGPIGYLRTIVPHVPLWLYPLMLVVEIIGHVAKPFALCVRLLANMTAGHIVLMVIMGFIFLFKSTPVVLISVAGALALTLLEIFVALVQAYVFTFLTAVFIGAAVHPEH